MFLAFALMQTNVTTPAVDAAIQLKAYPYALEQCRKIPEGTIERISSEVALLSRCGKSQEALKLFESQGEAIPQKIKEGLLEEICWSLLRQGSKAASQQEQCTAYLGMALSQDAYAIDFLLEAMHSPQWQTRVLAAHFSEPFCDTRLQKKVLTLIEDSSLKVRIAAIESASFAAAIPTLEERLTKKNLLPQEESALITTLGALYKKPTSEQIAFLLKSPHQALRQLACRLMLLSTCETHPILLNKALADSSFQVKIQALVTAGLKNVTLENVEAYLGYSSPTVATTAAWYLAHHGNEKGLLALKNSLSIPQKQHRLLAATALAKLAPQQGSFVQTCLKEASDPLVRANLAIGLFGQRIDMENSCIALSDLLELPSLLSLDRSHPLFITLTDDAKEDHPLCSKEEVDLYLRMQLLNLLAIAQAPNVEQKLKTFLKTHPWTLRLQALEVLLQESEGGAKEYVTSLLEDPDQQLAFQAALILSSFFRSPKAVHLLVSHYDNASFTCKIMILEALGKLPDPEGRACLLKALKSPSHTLRLAAATSLLRQLK